MSAASRDAGPAGRDSVRPAKDAGIPLLNRREWIAVAGMSAVIAGCESPEQYFTRPVLSSGPLLSGDENARASAPGLPSPEFRILNRLGYGPRPGDLRRVRETGLPGFVDEQLHPDRIDEDPAATWRVGALGDALNGDVTILVELDDHHLVAILRQAAILRAVYSRKQLLERMVEFWTDHFNIYAFKGQNTGPQLKTLDDAKTIRPHAIGRFREILGASARSAAMLGYLDNNVNRRGVPNENYARELMELHTLGVHGGYTQKDVQQVARCLTGWTMDTGWNYGQFKFDSALHDPGEKWVLGHRISAGGGIEDGERVLEILASHPATASHLSRKLCIFFTGDPPESLVRSTEAQWMRSNGDLRVTLRHILLSSDVWTGPPMLKRPFDLVTSALRGLNADTDGGRALHLHLDRMGQSLFAWPRPDGFPMAPEAWTGALVPRWNFAMAFASSQIDGTSIDWESIRALAGQSHTPASELLVELLYGARPGDAFTSSIHNLARVHSDPAEFAAVLMMAPSFQWR